MTLLSKWIQLLKIRSSRQEAAWVDVFQVMEDHLALLQKMKLENHGIPVRLRDQRDSSYNAFGFLTLSVPLEHAERARAILEKDE